ncbi:hypothetical protein [Rhodobacter sp. SY28-1]|uniref:hypothetical protein n=1 Tax=Rhodobacter sp. SY28-1 TaxID=2562317 RepID=UPI0010BF7ACD|nr:hypothetical protein [Rhodobacter sp. SY28-1]
MPKTLTILLALSAFATPAFADTELADKGTGAIYILGNANADGELPLANKLDGEIDTYLLTQDCYAKHPLYGLGAWQAVDSGWRIIVSGTQTVSFDGATPFDNPACVPQ